MTDLKQIEVYVLKLRSECEIAELGYTPRHEISAEAYRGGEIALLVEQQLVYTHFGYGSWLELRSPQVLRATINYIMRDTR
ncbi:hypothetical protein BV911_15705 [Pseudoruegeria sp. SK021]|nr:hypothetical protein BV911_15705 [Pseudoruegeria sp. SK021]